jgi:hypothetical protein
MSKIIRIWFILNAVLLVVVSLLDHSHYQTFAVLSCFILSVFVLIALLGIYIYKQKNRSEKKE